MRSKLLLAGNARCYFLFHEIFYVFEGDPICRKKEWPQYFPMKRFSCARQVSIQEWNSVYSILCQSSFQTTLFCDAGFVFFGINAMKEQRNFRSIKYSCTLSEKVHQNFHWHEDANVWKKTRSAVDRSAPEPVHLRFIIKIQIPKDANKSNTRHVFSKYRITASFNIKIQWVMCGLLKHCIAVNDSSSHMLKSNSFFQSL